MIEPWYRRYAWVVFVLVGLSGLIPGIQLSISPMSGLGFLEGFGYPIPGPLLDDPEAASFIAFLLRWTGLMVIGVDLMTVVIAATAFREGKQWAWLLFWYWPALFLAHFFMYEGPFRYAQLLWVALTAGALVLTFRRSRPVPPSAT